MGSQTERKTAAAVFFFLIIPSQQDRVKIPPGGARARPFKSSLENQLQDDDTRRTGPGCAELMRGGRPHPERLHFISLLSPVWQRRQQQHRSDGHSPPTAASPLHHTSSRVTRRAEGTAAGSAGSGKAGMLLGQRLADCLSHHFPGSPAAPTGRCPSLHVDRGFGDVASLWSSKASLLSLFSAQRREAL